MKTSIFEQKRRHMNRRAFFAVLMIISALPTVHFITGTAQSAGNTVLAISPSLKVVDYVVNFDFPTSFDLNVSISNVVDLSIWQIKLLFNPSILTCENLVEPSDGIFHGLETIGLGITIDNTAGYVGAYDGILTAEGVNGSGTLCRIHFDVKQPGISSIAFTDFGRRGGTIIYGSGLLNSMPFNATDGYVQVNTSGFQSNTFQAIKESVAYNVVTFTNSTVSEFGYDQNSEVITYVQTGPSGSNGSCTALIPDGLMNVSYFGVLINDNPTHFTLYADGANHFLLFTYGHSTSTVLILPTVAGDLNYDRKTDMKDVAIAAYSFGSIPGTPRWNPIADVNGDLKNDMRDLAFVAKYFGLSYQTV